MFFYYGFNIRQQGIILCNQIAWSGNVFIMCFTLPSFFSRNVPNIWKLFSYFPGFPISSNEVVWIFFTTLFKFFVRDTVTILYFYFGNGIMVFSYHFIHMVVFNQLFVSDYHMLAAWINYIGHIYLWKLPKSIFKVKF